MELKLSETDANKPLFLKIAFEGGDYAFYYATKKDKWKVLKKNVDGTFLSTRVSGGFVGTTLGMYATSNGKDPKGKAIFDWFGYEGNDAIYNK